MRYSTGDCGESHFSTKATRVFSSKRGICEAARWLEPDSVCDLGEGKPSNLPLTLISNCNNLLNLDEHKKTYSQKVQYLKGISHTHTRQPAPSGLKNKSPAIFSTFNKQWLSGFGHFSIRAIWEAAKWNGIHPAFLMENPKSIDVSLWNRQGPWVPSCGWRAYPNNPGQIACFSAAQLLTFFSGQKKKPTDRHTGMDNKKEHVSTVGVSYWVNDTAWEKEEKWQKSGFLSAPVDHNQVKTSRSSYSLFFLRCRF